MSAKKYISIIFIVYLFSPQISNAQIAKGVKEVLKKEAKAAKTVAKDAELAASNGLKKISASKFLSEGYEKNIKEFHRKYIDNELVDFLKDQTEDYIRDNFFELLDSIGSNSDSNSSNNNKIIYLNEIRSNSRYRQQLYPKICVILNKDTAQEFEEKALLLGYKIHGKGIDAITLYNYYFDFSNTFAKDELEKLKSLYKDNETANAEIDAIDKERNNSFDDKTNPSNDEQSETMNIIIGGLALLIFLGYLIYKVVMFIKNR